jgi:hypothetical protein
MTDTKATIYVKQINELLSEFMATQTDEPRCITIDRTRIPLPTKLRAPIAPHQQHDSDTVWDIEYVDYYPWEKPHTCTPVNVSFAGIKLVCKECGRDC